MRDAEKKRARLLNSNRKVNVIKGESKESKKIRDANTTTLMLIVVISVRNISHSIVDFWRENSNTFNAPSNDTF